MDSNPRNRKSDPSNWKRNKIPDRKARGQEHVGWTGKLVPARVQSPPCGCKKKCYDKFSEDEKKELLNKYNRLANKVAQDVLLQNGIRSAQVKRPTVNSNKPKSVSYYYFIKSGVREVNVCRKAYCGLFGEKEGRIKRLANLMVRGLPITDGRGKHNNRPNAYSEGILESIDKHIRTFPVRQTHYGSNQVYYLSSELSVAKMHRLFIEENYSCCFQFIKNGGDQDKACCLKLHVYRNYFNEYFNYKFGRPKTDICNVCEELKCQQRNTKGPEFEMIENKLKLHKVKANSFYRNLDKTKNMVKEHENIECIVFDFMQHIPVPHINVNEIFYLRQIWLYTFGIHHYNKTGDKAYFYMWAESDAKHGVNEVISCLNDFINDKVSPQCDTIHLFSDACPGQNRNSCMVQYLISLVNCSRFKLIKHFFPIRGHSFLPCDSDFAKLGKIKKMKERAGVPGDWVAAFKENNQVKVFPEISFHDFSSHFSKFFKKKVTKNKNAFTVTKYQRFVYTKGSANFEVSKSMESNIWENFNLLKNGIKITDLVMPDDRIYLVPFSVPIKFEKMDNVKRLYKYLDKNEIEYYNSMRVKAAETENVSTDEECL